jgi:hypothetical protein
MRWSAQIHACFPVAGVTWDVPKGNRISFTYGAVTFYGRSFQTIRLEMRFVKSSPAEWQGQDIPQHRARNAHSLDTCIGLGFSAFARRYRRNRWLCLFPRLLRCFTSARVAS